MKQIFRLRVKNNGILFTEKMSSVIFTESLATVFGFALCSSVESLVSDSFRKGSTDEYLVIYYD